jgi:hypothetical protein
MFDYKCLFISKHAMAMRLRISLGDILGEVIVLVSIGLRSLSHGPQTRLQFLLAAGSAAPLFNID